MDNHALVREALRQQLLQNLRDLQLNRDNILPDVLSVTQEVTRMYHLLNRHFLSPVLRAKPTDRLCLGMN